MLLIWFCIANVAGFWIDVAAGLDVDVVIVAGLDVDVNVDAGLGVDIIIVTGLVAVEVMLLAGLVMNDDAFAKFVAGLVTGWKLFPAVA